MQCKFFFHLRPCRFFFKLLKFKFLNYNCHHLARKYISKDWSILHTCINNMNYMSKKKWFSTILKLYYCFIYKHWLHWINLYCISTCEGVRLNDHVFNAEDFQINCSSLNMFLLAAREINWDPLEIISKSCEVCESVWLYACVCVDCFQNLRCCVWWTLTATEGPPGVEQTQFCGRNAVTFLSVCVSVRSKSCSERRTFYPGYISGTCE